MTAASKGSSLHPLLKSGGERGEQLLSMYGSLLVFLFLSLCFADVGDFGRPTTTVPSPQAQGGSSYPGRGGWEEGGLGGRGRAWEEKGRGTKCSLRAGSGSFRGNK